MYSGTMTPVTGPVGTLTKIVRLMKIGGAVKLPLSSFSLTRLVGTPDGMVVLLATLRVVDELVCELIRTLKVFVEAEEDEVTFCAEITAIAMLELFDVLTVLVELGELIPKAKS